MPLRELSRSYHIGRLFAAAPDHGPCHDRGSIRQGHPIRGYILYTDTEMEETPSRSNRFAAYAWAFSENGASRT